MKGPQNRIVLKTPAKINLLLHIVGKRDDGYHDIITVMQMVDLWDEITIEEAENINLVSSDPEVPPGQENLIYKAAVILKEHSKIKRGAKITLQKAIPVAGGLGGGSSDAAATLFGLNALWGLSYGNKRLMAIGRELGSDIPFFLNGPTAIGHGRGDELLQLISHTDYWFLLINPGIHISTAWAYSQKSEVRSREPVSYKWIGPFTRTNFGLTNGKSHYKIPLPASFRLKGDRIWLLPFNDLEEVVTRRYPIINKIKEKMVACGAMCSLMSGSGSTVFGIFEDRNSAERADKVIHGQGWKSWVVKALQGSPYSNNNYQT